MSSVAPIVAVRGLAKRFDVSPPWLERVLERRPRMQLRAVDGVDLAIERGETFALVGESGCGKSTIARLIVGLYAPSAGNIAFEGTVIAGDGAASDAAAVRAVRRRMQMIFQDPYASLNPRWRVGDIVAEPIRAHRPQTARDDAARQVARLLEQVGLGAVDSQKFPHQFSGGQRQRISIARALAARPDFLICDEPTSALDVSVQAQVLNLMRDLQRELSLTYLFISHNLAVVHHLADRVAVMYLGRIVELAPKRQLFRAPQHPYTRMLLEAVPDIAAIDARRTSAAGPSEGTDRSLAEGWRDRATDTPIRVAGEVPNPLDPPPGCAFHPRCPLAMERCRSETPMLRPREGGAQAACHALDAAPRVATRDDPSARAVRL